MDKNTITNHTGPEPSHSYSKYCGCKYCGNPHDKRCLCFQCQDAAVEPRLPITSLPKRSCAVLKNCSCATCNGKRLAQAIKDNTAMIPPYVMTGEPRPAGKIRPLLGAPYKHPQYKGVDVPMVSMSQISYDIKLAAQHRFGYITGMLIGVSGSIVVGALAWWALS